MDDLVVGSVEKKYIKLTSAPRSTQPKMGTRENVMGKLRWLVVISTTPTGG